MRGSGSVKVSDSLEGSSGLVTEQISDGLIRSLWWLLFSAELVFIAIYSFLPFTHPWGNPGLWRVSSVFLWTSLGRLLFWRRPALGASVVLIGIMLTIPLLVNDEGGLFSSAFARLTVLSLPALFLSFLWGWRGAVASALSSLPILLLSQSTFSEDALIGCLLLLTTMLCGAYIHHLVINMQRVQNELKNMAMRDALTRLGNRYALETDFQALGGSGRLSMWDVNGLKRVNDQHGHAVGDLYLLQFVRAFSAATHDRLYRVGGDEFVGLHPQTTTMKALRLAVLREFAQVSSGWTELDDRNLDMCLHDADEAMYSDKNGRATDRPTVVRDATKTSVSDVSQTQLLEPKRLLAALEEQ